MSTALFLSPTPEMQYSTQLTCPPSPRPTRRHLSTHLQTHHVTSFFAPMPFNCQGGTVSGESRVLTPRPIYGTSRSVFACLPRLSSVIDDGQKHQDGTGIDNAIEESCKAINVLTIAESKDSKMREQASLKANATAIAATNIKKTRRRSSFNSAA